MAYFSWVAEQDRLTNVDLTILVQAINPYDTDQLLWDVFFPRQDVPSVRLDNITPLIPTRFVADRREWNARGRLIPQETPSTSELEMVPIESFFKMGEREVQSLIERTQGNQDLFRQLVITSIPDRTRSLARANFRRIEVDTFGAWANGSVVSMNPVTGTTVSMSFGFSGSRYQTAGPAWTGGSSGTAYANFVQWLRDGYAAGISIGGAMMRLSTEEAIRTSAPNIAFPYGATNIQPLLSDVETRISQEVGQPFRFYVNERHVDSFTDGGITTSAVNIWPSHKVALVPAGEVVGYNAFAPVARAYELAKAAPEAEIQVNGMVAYSETGNNGRDLTVECQVNALPVPLESKVWVIDAGI